MNCQSSITGSRALAEQAQQQREARGLRSGRQVGGDRQRRAFVGVRRPHVEGHGRDLEAEAGDDQGQAGKRAEGEAARCRC